MGENYRSCGNLAWSVGPVYVLMSGFGELVARRASGTRYQVEPEPMRYGRIGGHASTTG
jgi:hypothetical protein